MRGNRQKRETVQPRDGQVTHGHLAGKIDQAPFLRDQVGAVRGHPCLEIYPEDLFNWHFHRSKRTPPGWVATRKAPLPRGVVSMWLLPLVSVPSFPLNKCRPVWKMAHFRVGHLWERALMLSPSHMRQWHPFVRTKLKLVSATSSSCIFA